MEDKIIADPERHGAHSPSGSRCRGGDPLHPQNVPDIPALVQRIRAECPGERYLRGPQAQ